MAKYAIVVMSEHSEGSPGGQGRMIHALSAAQALRNAGEDVTIWFHGLGVTWLSAFDARYDAFTRHYGPLFDELRDSLGGTCSFCTVKRFGTAESAERLGVPIVGPDDGHHNIADLIADGRQVITF